MVIDEASMREHLSEVRSQIEVTKRKIEKSEAYIQQVFQEHEQLMKRQKAELAVLEQEEQQLLVRLQQEEEEAAQQGKAIKPPAAPNGMASSGSSSGAANCFSQQQVSPTQQGQPAAGEPAGHEAIVAPMVAQFAQLLPGFQAAPPPSGHLPHPAIIPSSQPLIEQQLLLQAAAPQQQGAAVPVPFQPRTGTSPQQQGTTQPSPSARELVPRAVQLASPRSAQGTSQLGQAPRRPPPGFAGPRPPPPGFEGAKAGPAQQGQNGTVPRLAPPGFDGANGGMQSQAEGRSRGVDGPAGAPWGDEHPPKEAETTSASGGSPEDGRNITMVDQEIDEPRGAGPCDAPGATVAAAAGPEVGAHAAEEAGCQEGNGAAPASGEGAAGGYSDLLEGVYAPATAPVPEWWANGACSAEVFPSLGAPAPSVGPAGASAGAGGGGAGGAWGNKWATGALRDRLKQAAGPPSREPFPALAPAPAPAPALAATQPAAAVPGIEEVEQRCGLRVPGDNTPDLQRRRQVRKHTFTHVELVGRRPVNIAEGLELHEGVLSPAEQAQLVQTVDHWVALGRTGGLRGRTFSAPRKWMPGKGRITAQFGCCYNYAVDDQGRDPGIIPEEIVEPMPPVLRALCRRLTRWHLLPRATEPDSAIVNIYEEGDCIPPHIDHFDFLRPFCTISLLSEQPIMFSKKLIARGPGDFGAPEGSEPALVPLPTGSCLVLRGYGGEKAEHCIPPVASRRISITLRCMAPSHRAAVQREIKRYAEEHGPLRPFWVEDTPRQGAVSSYITIK